MANYCRSPVAEFFLKEKFGDKFDISSAGLIDFELGGMDERSIDFIESKNLKPSFHQPKKITSSELLTAEIVYAIDLSILMSLNKKFNKMKKNIKLFEIKGENHILSDPYKYDRKAYFNIMEKIYYISSNISIDI